MRRSVSLRPIKIKKSYLPHSEGSCLISMGQTQVLCVATVEDKAPPHADEKGIGWIHAEYAMLPRSGEERTSRRRASGSGRAQEISRLIGRSLRAAVQMEAFPQKTITIDCDVIRADGGTRTAAINGGFVALVQALRFLKKSGSLHHWPVPEFIGAVSIGMIKNKTILDMAYEHDKEADLDLNVVMTESGKLVEIQGTAEEHPFSIRDLNRMIQISKRAIHTINRSQRKVLGSLLTH